MKRPAALLAGLFAALLVTGAAQAASFGGSLSPNVLILERDPHTAVVRNRGEVPVSVTLAIGKGYTLSADAFPLAPGQAQTVSILTVGTEDTRLDATLTNTEPGQDRAAIVLSGIVRHRTFMEAVLGAIGAPAGTPVVPLALLAAVGALAAAWAIRRRRRESGQGLAEYALILALIAVVAIVALFYLGGQVSSILSDVGASV